MRMCHFWAQNGPFVMNKFFLVQTIIITFIYLLALFIVQNFKKFLQQIQSYEDVPFLGPKWSICPKQIFFWKIINIILIYLLAPFIVQNFKKILPADPELWGCTIFGPKMAHFPKWEFFQKTCSWALFLSSMQPDFSQACSFCKMLMNHKNFHFTQIPDKTNDMIFLKSPKTLFLGHFWPFLIIFARWRFFP